MRRATLIVIVVTAAATALATYGLISAQPYLAWRSVPERMSTSENYRFLAKFDRAANCRSASSAEQASGTTRPVSGPAP